MLIGESEGAARLIEAWLSLLSYPHEERKSLLRSRAASPVLHRRSRLRRLLHNRLPHRRPLYYEIHYWLRPEIARGRAFQEARPRHGNHADEPTELGDDYHVEVALPEKPSPQ